MKLFKSSLLLCFLSLCLISCSEDNDIPKPVNQHEVISDVTLSFTDAKGETATYTYTDPRYREQDYTTPVIQLDTGEVYQVSVKFLDKTDPAHVEDITAEVIEEKDDHFVEYGFTSVQLDLIRTDNAETTDSNGVQIGIHTQWTPLEAGQGQVQVTLIHQPESKDTSNPNGDHTGGETDAQVRFDLVIK